MTTMSNGVFRFNALLLYSGLISLNNSDAVGSTRRIGTLHS